MWTKLTVDLRLGVQESTTESESDSQSADDAPIVVSDDSWIEDVGEEFDDSLMPRKPVIGRTDRRTILK